MTARVLILALSLLMMRELDEWEHQIEEGDIEDS